MKAKVTMEFIISDEQFKSRPRNESFESTVTRIINYGTILSVSDDDGKIIKIEQIE